MTGTTGGQFELVVRLNDMVKFMDRELRLAIRANMSERANDDDLIRCPVCEIENTHMGSVELQDGKDSYQADWWGRGDLAKISLWSECGCSWELCFGFHKGGLFPFANIIESCDSNYRVYLSSEAWKVKAKAAKERAGWRCQVCNASKDETVLDAHHRTYERVGNERDDDITVLCRDCHTMYERNKTRGR